VVTEYRSISKRCPYCGTLNHGTLPFDINQPIQYGPGTNGFLI
jgi:hypothetical protein